MKKTLIVLLVLVLVAAVAWFVFFRQKGPAQDEAMAKGVPLDFFHQAADEADYFKDADGGIEMTPAEVRGRNTWFIWTGGNEAFWDWLANNSFGTFDLLKTISSFPCSPETEAEAGEYESEVTQQEDYAGSYGGELPSYRYYKRSTRFHYLGLMNEPGFRQATKPDEFGLCLDERVAPPEPFNEKVYGRASGVAGLRLYPNPNFDEKARAKWDGEKYYTDPTYYTDRNLVRPYRVGMACSFCHISHHPLHPPDDPENPEWANLSGTIGAQYFWFGRIFGANVTPDNFVWHLLDAQQPGAVDTSFVPADNLNNPRAMNSLFNLVARLDAGTRFHQERMTGGALDLPEVMEKGPVFGVPHILWDGADSVGIDAALTRVYINIGEYHQEWIRHIRPILGGQQSPITVKAAQENSIYWQATQERADDLKAYLVKAAYPYPLAEAPGGDQYLQGDRTDEDYQALLHHGKVVFAETCARCHSSKIPKPAPGLDDGVECSGSHYLECWNRYWDWTRTDDFKQKMTEMVLADGFLDDNYLSNDARIPVTLLGTEICSAMAPNAIAGHVWDNFSSQSYKELPSVGEVELWDPIRDVKFEWQTPAGGRGYQRVPTLVSIWSTAPYLHNNEIGIFTNDPSTEGRMRAFDDAIHKMLYPERRPGTIRRTDRVTTLNVSEGYLPAVLKPVLRPLISDDGWLKIGPIPQGTPVNLLANLNIDISDPRVKVTELGSLLVKIIRRLKEVKKEQLDDAAATELLEELVPDLIQASGCPDFVADRGHTFGSDRSDEDKEALIEFIKTL